MSRAVLAMESGGVTASVALMDRSGQLHSSFAASGQSHSSQLLPMAQSLLSQAKMTWAELDGIAVCTGPGSFTGLRIACGVAQGLALAAHQQVLGVSGFEVWAYAWWRSHRVISPSDQTHSGQAQRFDVSFDARLGERFHASLTIAESSNRLSMQWIDSPSVVPQESCVPSQSQSPSIELCDPQPDSLREALPLAAWIARYATDPACVHAHQWLAPRDLRPLYVRDKVAQTIEERRHSSDLQWSAMRQQDIASVMVIEHQAYPFPWTSGNFLDSLNAGYDMQVLKERGVMIGYLVWMQVLKEAHLLNITLSPARQGHGLGAWMMRQFISRLEAMDIDEVLLEVRPSNQKALSLYRRCGFEQIGIRRGYYPNNAALCEKGGDSREDAMVMRRVLRGHRDTQAHAPFTAARENHA